MSNSLVEVLLVARRIANRAKDEGALYDEKHPRATCEHQGGVLQIFFPKLAGIF